jgi:hypothetical protein
VLFNRPRWLCAVASILFTTLLTTACDGLPEAQHARPNQVGQQQGQLGPQKKREEPKRSAQPSARTSKPKRERKAHHKSKKQPSKLAEQHPATKQQPGKKDSSGVLLITRHGSGDLYALFGKERQGGHGASLKWNFMRGGIEHGETYLKNAKRELREETAGFYNVSLEKIAKAPYSIFEKGPPWNNRAFTFIVKVNNYIEERQMKQKSEAFRNSGADHHLWEMTDYQWVKLRDLIASLEQNNRFLNAVTSPTHATAVMEIYDYSFDALRKALPELKAISTAGDH